MKIFSIILLAITFLFSACSQEKESKTSAVGENLKEQTFKIKTGIDTVFTSENGTKIFIAKNTFPADVKEIEIKFKDALTLAEMVKAGLTTTSDGKILSTGGMIYISASADGKEVTLQNAIKIQVRSPKYDPEMKLFKGEITENGINWKLVGDLVADSAKQTYLRGKQIFESNCTACHKMGGVLVGPDLTYVTERRNKKWLNTFTKNSQALIQNGDKTAICLYKSFSVIMPPQDLNDQQIEDLYNYIEIYSNISNNARQSDNCNSLNAEATLNLLQAKEDSFRASNTSIYLGYDSARTSNTTVVSSSYYYEFNVQGYGWYNCDRFLESNENITPQISVDFTDKKLSANQILIVIPKLKAIIPCQLIQGKLSNSWVQFRLPKNEKAVIVFVNNKDKKENYFYKSLILIDQPVTIKIDSFNKDYKEIETELQ